MATVIDPGFDGERIIDILSARDVTVERILLTHAHIDHLCAVEEVYSALGSHESDILLHPDDSTLIEHIDAQADFLGAETPSLPAIFTPVRDGDFLTCSGHSIQVLPHTRAFTRQL